ncbi:MAG: phage tail protein [Saprospiraceae bacterium]
MEPVFMAQVMMFGGNFAPRGWAFCDGQLLSINQYQALFSLLGTIYGGDGRTTFALPDLRGRVGVHPGRGPGLSDWRQGQRTGTQENFITQNQMAAHGHNLATGTGTASIGVNQEEPSSDEAAGKVLGSTDGNIIYNSSPADGTLANGSPVNLGGMSANTGGSQPVNNIKPSLGINYIIALEGTYPSRS